MSNKKNVKIPSFMELHKDLKQADKKKKPPLSTIVSRKRKASENILSTITNISFSPFRQRRKRHHSMGTACTKGSKVSSELSPSHHQSSKTIKSNGRQKVTPSPTHSAAANVEEVKAIFRSHLDVKQTSPFEADIHSSPVEHFYLEDIQEKQAKSFNHKRSSNSSISAKKRSSYQDKLGLKRNSHSSASSSSCEDTDMFKDRPTSLPDLRLDDAKNRVNRSCSQGDSQLKSSIGSTNLLNIETKNLLLRRSSHCDSPRRSSEYTLNVGKRRKRLPTVENGVHVLEADQVNYYQILEEIGRGSFGSVCKCLCHKDNKYYAMKIISKKRIMRKNRMLARHPKSTSNPLEPLQKEIAILKKMDHPNIVKLIEVIDDVQVDNVYMIFELVQNGVVIEVPTQNVIPEDRSRRLFRDLLLGIEYLHYSKIIHRDIKPSNLLLDNNDRIKIADFGVSNMFEGEDDLLSKYAGSPAFQAPEVLNYDSRDKYSGKAVDIWAMGVTLFCFLYGQCPFFSNNFAALSTMIKTEPVKFPEDPVVNQQAIDLMSRMLSKQPKERITVLEIKDHPWVTEGGQCLLPTTAEHCAAIEVTDEEVKNSIKIISKLSSLVLAKSVLRGKSFVGSIRKNSNWKLRNNSVPST